MSVATNRPTRDGEKWTEITDWHKVVLFDWQARVCGDQLRKGDAVAVMGELRYRQWTDDTGTKRYSSEIAAREVSFLGGARAGRAAPTAEIPAEVVEGPTPSGPTLIPEPAA